LLTFSLLLPAQYTIVRAQVDSTHCIGDTLGHRTDSINYRHKLAIFLPLYLDSAFDASNNYRYDKSFPK